MEILMIIKSNIFKILLLLLLYTAHIQGQSLLTHYEKTDYLESDNYYEVISFYKTLDKKSKKIQVLELGSTDANLPLHLILLSSDGKTKISNWNNSNKVKILINNSIHPGEPDGMQACMLLVRDIVDGKYILPANVSLAIIPIYNIGGSLERSTFYRIDQNGPLEKGKRANSQNYDLNRDFIKCDAQESKSFAEIFHMVMPDIFIDTHTSNGADYQHTMTLLTTQHNKLGGDLGKYLHEKMEPALFDDMKNKGMDMIPYVNHFGSNPERGWEAFWDSPRYSSGFTSLYHTISFVPETHMLKPYKDRVNASSEIIKSIIKYSDENYYELKSKIALQRSKTAVQKHFPLKYAIDSSKHQIIKFKGYEAERKPSKISGLTRLYYNREKPFEKDVKFYNYFITTLQVEKPKAYVISSAWHRVIELLRVNNVKMTQLKKDTSMEVEVYKIIDTKSSSRLYEGHHLNSEVKIEKRKEYLSFRKGDYYIPMNQSCNRYIIEVLEPESPDGFYAWNFFDSILNQKEGFSSYVFEDTAEKYLDEHPEILLSLKKRKENDTAFANDHEAQLEYIFQQSDFFEKNYKIYPVYRVP
jgi:hypothetical protein